MGVIYMKETKSLKTILVFLVIFGVIYNVFLMILLNSLDHYNFENIFFAIRYEDLSNAGVWLSLPHFMNWLILVSFVFFTVVLSLRIHMNKEMKVKRANK